MRLLGVLGPVFLQEWLVTSRRRQMYALRSAFVALLGAGLAVVWVRYLGNRASDIRSLAATGESFFYALVGIQLLVILLAAPSSTAGAIDQDRARGKILQLLATDLSSTHIVLGLWAARLMSVLGLLFCSLPVLFAAVLLGGIAPEALLGAYGVTAGVVVLGCALALLLSLWGTTTHEVLLINYFVWIFGLLLPWMWSVGGNQGWLPPVPGWFHDLNPFRMAFLPYLRPGHPCLGDQASYFLGCLGLSTVLVLMAVFSLRRTIVNRSSRAVPIRDPRPRPRWSLLRLGPSLDRNPLLWREWHGRRLTRWARSIWLAYAFLALFFAVLAGIERWSTTSRILMPRLVNGFLAAVGLLLVAISAPRALAEERNRGDLEVLLATPVPTRSIVCAKWRRAFHPVPWLALPPVILHCICAFQSGSWLPVGLLVAMILAVGAALCSFGLALATRLKRAGSALAWCVGTYVFITTIWMPLIILFLRSRHEVIGSGSPFVSAAVLTACSEDDPVRDYWYALTWNLIWLLVYAVAAALLLSWTVRNFDRHVGRMPETGIPPQGKV